MLAMQRPEDDPRNKFLRKSSATKTLSFFRDCARKKWPLRGSKSAGYLYQIFYFDQFLNEHFLETIIPAPHLFLHQ